LRRRRLLAAIALAGAVAATWALASGEVPLWTIGGTRLARHEPLPPLGRFPITVAAGSTIRFEGDSDTWGSRIGGPDFAYPAIFAKTANAGLDIRNHGRGGATAPFEPVSYPAETRPALGVIMFGSNDAASRGILASRTPIPYEDFRSRMVRLIRARQAEGSQVLVLAAPPAGGVAMDRRMAPYRTIAREAAAATGAHFLDPMGAYTGHLDRVLAQYDALHLNREAQVLMGEWLARHIRVAETANVPATR